MNNFDNFVPKSPLSLYSFGPPQAGAVAQPRTSKLRNSDTAGDSNKENSTNNKDSEKSNDNLSKPTLKPTAANIAEEFNRNLRALKPSNEIEQAEPPKKSHSSKTVAFGLTTKMGDSVESSRQPQRRASALRSSTVLYTAPVKDIEEVQKLLKSQKDDVEKLREENAELRKTTDELHSSMSNLTRIVTEISSRVMELEDQRKDLPRLVAELARAGNCGAQRDPSASFVESAGAAGDSSRRADGKNGDNCTDINVSHRGTSTDSRRAEPEQRVVKASFYATRSNVSRAKPPQNLQANAARNGLMTPAPNFGMERPTTSSNLLPDRQRGRNVTAFRGPNRESNDGREPISKEESLFSNELRVGTAARPLPSKRVGSNSSTFSRTTLNVNNPVYPRSANAPSDGVGSGTRTVARRLLDDREDASVRRPNSRNDEVSELLALIENRLRKEPGFLGRAKQILVGRSGGGGVGNNAYAVTNFGVRARNRISPSSKQRVENYNPSSVLVSDNPPTSYGAKYTQKMTLEREFVYSSPLSAVDSKTESNYQRKDGAISQPPPHQQQRRRVCEAISQPSTQHFSSAADDDEFFANEEDILVDDDNDYPPPPPRPQSRSFDAGGGRVHSDDIFFDDNAADVNVSFPNDGDGDADDSANIMMTTDYADNVDASWTSAAVAANNSPRPPAYPPPTATHSSYYSPQQQQQQPYQQCTEEERRARYRRQ